MKLKRKLLLTSATALVAVTPIATVISCGDTKAINNNINDPINDSDVVINASNNDLIISGKDGAGTFKFDVSPNQKKLLKVAGATYEYFVKRYKKGPSAKFEAINKIPYTDISAKPAINDLSVDDEIKVKVSLKKSGFIFKGNGIFQKKITDDEKDGLNINWYEPATSTTNADSMVERAGDAITITFNKDVKSNELIFKIAKELGYLFSDKTTRFVAKLADKTTDPITMKDICESLTKATSHGVKKIILKHGATTDTLNLESMKNLIGRDTINITKLIKDGYDKLKGFKGVPLDDSSVAPEEVFTADSIALSFASNYGTVAIPIKDKLLTLIGAMKNDPEALGFIPKLAIGYGNIFQWMIKSKTFNEWVQENHIRKNEVIAIPNIFMATLFRTKNN